MAWTDVIYSCGHTDRIQLYGPGKERERWLYAAEQYKLCPVCLAEQRKQAAIDAAAQNKGAGLPELTGSAKQIAWAEQIRAKVVAKIGEDEFLPDRIDEYRATILAAAATKTSAAWWIDRRTNPRLAILDLEDDVSLGK